mgnify:CR=1 FL=1
MTNSLLYQLLVIAIVSFAVVTIIYCNPLKTYYLMNKGDFYARGLQGVTRLSVFKKLIYSPFYKEIQDKEIPQIGDTIINTLRFSDKQQKVVERIFLIDKNRRLPILLIEEA